jgi:hypothetical protein
MSRLHHTGALSADPSGGHTIVFAGGCSSCSAAGCMGANAGFARTRPVPVASAGAQVLISGRIAANTDAIADAGTDVDVSISRRGLTLACLLLFGPALLVVAATAWLNAQGFTGALFAVTSLAVLTLVLIVSAKLISNWGNSLIDLNIGT